MSITFIFAIYLLHVSFVVFSQMTYEEAQ